MKTPHSYSNRNKIYEGFFLWKNLMTSHCANFRRKNNYIFRVITETNAKLLRNNA